MRTTSDDHLARWRFTTDFVTSQTIRIHSLKLANRTSKMNGWNTIVSFWGKKPMFRGENVSFREGIPYLGKFTVPGWQQKNVYGSTSNLVHGRSTYTQGDRLVFDCFARILGSKMLTFRGLLGGKVINFLFGRPVFFCFCLEPLGLKATFFVTNFASISFLEH